MSRIEFDAIWARANGRCELTGIAFTEERMDGKVKRPWMPSVDRVNNAKGYEFSNCRLVCISVNLALNEFGDEALIRIAKGLLFRAEKFRCISDGERSEADNDSLTL